jgi:hypothetical protein
MGNRMWSQIQSALRNLRHTQQDRCKEVPWNGHSHASLILLARPPRLKAHIPLQSSPSALTRGGLANSLLIMVGMPEFAVIDRTG